MRSCGHDSPRADEPTRGNQRAIDDLGSSRPARAHLGVAASLLASACGSDSGSSATTAGSPRRSLPQRPRRRHDAPAGGADTTAAAATDELLAATADKSPVLIAALVDLTGPSTGPANMPDVIKAWGDYINAKGGINGHPVTFDIQDTKGDAATAQSQLEDDAGQEAGADPARVVRHRGRDGRHPRRLGCSGDGRRATARRSGAATSRRSSSRAAPTPARRCRAPSRTPSRWRPRSGPSSTSRCSAPRRPVRRSSPPPPAPRSKRARRRRRCSPPPRPPSASRTPAAVKVELHQGRLLRRVHPVDPGGRRLHPDQRRPRRWARTLYSSCTDQGYRASSAPRPAR